MFFHVFVAIVLWFPTSYILLCSFQIHLSSPTGDAVLQQPDKADAIINANDNPQGIISLRSPDLISRPQVHLNEDLDSDASFTIVRTAGSFGSVSVSWNIIRNDTYTGDVSLDLNPVSGSVIFAAGDREKDVQIFVIQDTLPEPAERFKLRLIPESASGGVTVDGITEGIILIEDSDNIYGTVQFADNIRQTLVIVSFKTLLYPF